MKYRPLCASYLTDTKSRLEEAEDPEKRPLLFIESVICNSAEEESASLSESECEQQQEAPPPALPLRVRKRARFSLDDDSFEFIKQQQDPVKEKSSIAEESSQNEEMEADEALLHDEDESLLESVSKEANESTLHEKSQQAMEDDIFSMDTSSDGEVLPRVKPFQLETLVTIRKRASIPVPTTERHPLEDTDDDESNEVEIVGRTSRMTKKEHPPPVVDVSIQHCSPVEDSLLDSQSQDTEMVDNEANIDEQNVSYTVMPGTADVLSSPTDNDASDCNVQEVEDKATETMEVANDTCLLVEANDVIMEDEQQVAEDATKMQRDVVMEYQRIDSTVIERIMQTLRDCLSRKLITADPRNAATFHRGHMSSARAGFWASGPNHDSMTTSPASFFDIVYGNEGMHHFHLLQSLRDSGRSIISTEPESPVKLKETNDLEETTTTVVDTETGSVLKQPPLAGQKDSNQEMEGETRTENTPASTSSPDPSDQETEMTRVKDCLVANEPAKKVEAPQDRCDVAEIHESIVTALSESRALVTSRNPTPGVPPIWFQVCKAIMDLQMEDPEALRILVSSTGNCEQAFQTRSVADIKHQESIRGEAESSAVDNACSNEGQTPNFSHKSSIASLEAPVVSDEKSKKTAVVQEQNHRSEEENPRHRRRTEQEKLDRKDRKRLKREKRERKKQKKAERKERKRKARDQNHHPDEPLDSPPPNTVQQQPLIERSVENQGVGFATKDIADTRQDEKRQKVEKIQVSDGVTSETLFVREQFDKESLRKENSTRQEPKQECSIEPTFRSEKPSFKPNVMQPKQSDNCTGNRRERKGNQQKPTGSTRPPTGSRMKQQEETENAAPSLRALCSEAFFEEWSEATSLLASGQWLSLCAPLRQPDDDSPPPLGPSIQLFDTPLLDERGIDIELPGHAIIIFQLSSWGTTAEARNICAKHLVQTTALETYKEIDVIIVADVDISAALSIDIAFVQNAVVAHAGLSYSCSPSFQVIAPRLLAPVVASRVMSTPAQGVRMESFINASIGDIRLQERVRFMLSLAPSLGVVGAIQCLVCLSNSSEDGEQNVDDFTSQGFQRLIRGCTTIDRNDPAIRQLTLALNISFSHGN